MKKLAIIFLTVYLLLLVLVGAIMMAISNSSDTKKSFAASAASKETPERILELMRLAEIGVPSDIVMMITTLQCETEEEAQKKPFMDNALEFMVVTEIISEKHHTCDRYNDDGSETLDDEAECNCDFKVVATNFHYYKEEILGYLGATEPAADLNAENLLERLQAAADEKAEGRAYETKIQVQINAIDDTLYENAIKRCGIEEKDKIKAIIVLHEAGYFTEWFKERTAEMGIELSEGITTGGVNGTHSRIMAAIAGDTSPFAGGPFGDPVSGWRGMVSCEFGGYPGHTGIDFAAPIGTPVYASISGTVIITGSGSTGYGNYVVINHGGGIATLYAHNSSVLVGAGEEVTKGQVIAYSGNTGNSTGPHLHFEVVVKGTPKNPRGYL